ncbi:hypothetical protein ACET3Z_029956 [Daucus carota]
MTETVDVLSDKKLEGKVAIITGGASGIGEATARLFAQHGARAIVIADIQDALGQSVAKSIGNEQCTYRHCDVADEGQVKALIDSTVETFGSLDIMFSNAGFWKTGDFRQSILDLNLEASDRLFAVNTRGMAACVKHAARAMVEGSVKGGCVVTPLACKEFALSEEECEKYFEGVMDLKGFGAIKAKDIANAVLFLACQDSQFITGQNLIVDGENTLKL